MSWDLSPLYQTSRGASLCARGRFVASVLNERLVVRDTDSLHVIRAWELPQEAAPKAEEDWHVAIQQTDEPHCLAVWSKARKRAIVYRPDDDVPVADIAIGNEGLDHIHFLDQSVMLFSSHKLRVTLYDLTGHGQQGIIDRPKASNGTGLAVRQTDSDAILAILERHDGRDSVGLYNARTLLRHVALPDDANLSDVSWSPCGRFITLLSTVLNPRLLIITPDGRTLFDSGMNLQSTEAVMANAWHPSGDYFATLDLSGQLAFRHRTSWLPVEQSQLFVPSFSAAAQVYREPKDWRAQARGAGIVKFELSSGPVEHNPNHNGDSHRSHKLAFASSGTRLAVWTSDDPKVLFIIDFDGTGAEGKYARLNSIIVAAEPVRSFAWQPNAGFDDSEDALVVVSGDRSFVVWRATSTATTPHACEGVAIPSNVSFAPNAVAFDSTNKTMLLSSPTAYLVASQTVPN